MRYKFFCKVPGCSIVISRAAIIEGARPHNCLRLCSSYSTGAHTVVRFTFLTCCIVFSVSCTLYKWLTYSKAQHRIDNQHHIYDFVGHAQTSCNYFILSFQQAMTSSHHEMFNYPGRFRDLRWDGSHSAEVNENINLSYSQDQGYS